MNLPVPPGCELRDPKWTFREYVGYTWHHWTLPLFGIVVLASNAFVPLRPWVLVWWAACYGVHTWLLTRALMWHHKFHDSIADSYVGLCKHAFAAGVEVGRQDDKPWLQHDE